MKPKMTHTGLVSGRKIVKRVELRETKLYWVNGCGTKFSKQNNGVEPGILPMLRLDLGSIEPIEEE